MLNQVILVGRVMNINKKENTTTITLNIDRNSNENKNAIDAIDVELTDNINVTTIE